MEGWELIKFYQEKIRQTQDMNQGYDEDNILVSVFLSDLRNLVRLAEKQLEKGGGK